MRNKNRIPEFTRELERMWIQYIIQIGDLVS